MQTFGCRLPVQYHIQQTLFLRSQYKVRFPTCYVRRVQVNGKVAFDELNAPQSQQNAKYINVGLPLRRLFITQWAELRQTVGRVR